jgi:glycerophosphoryl diester phosphodiesterase
MSPAPTAVPSKLNFRAGVVLVGNALQRLPELPVHPFVIGHRGCGRRTSADSFFENTLAGFVHAAHLGAAWVELDAKLNADRELVLHHNVHFDQVPISTMSSQQCRHVGLATLEQVHAGLPDGVGIDLEVKFGPTDATSGATIDACVAWAAAHRHDRPLLVTSFDPSVPAAAAAVRLPSGWITRTGWPLYESVTSAARLGCAAAVAHVSEVVDMNPDHPGPGVLLGLLADTGVRLWAWDATAQDAPLLISRGVTGLITDDITGVASAVAAHERNTPS